MPINNTRHKYIIYIIVLFVSVLLVFIYPLVAVGLYCSIVLYLLVYNIKTRGGLYAFGKFIKDILFDW